ncbi:hypothetical protein [Eremococcus coleocola]|nr:hypothetical protein [Eremococcus coleocola]
MAGLLKGTDTVWGLGHTQAERTGTASDIFIQWIKDSPKMNKKL